MFKQNKMKNTQEHNSNGIISTTSKTKMKILVSINKRVTILFLVMINAQEMGIISYDWNTIFQVK